MYKDLIANVLDHIGGGSNIAESTHCMTRLRLEIIDVGKVNKEALEKIKGVLGVVINGNQVQIIIGPSVSNVYKEFVEVTSALSKSEPSSASVKTDTNSGRPKEKTLTKVMNTIAGIFNPIVPALAGAGLIKAILALLVSIKVLSNQSETYLILNTISDGVFTFLPFLLAISSAKIFKMNTYVAVAIAAAMLHPTFLNFLMEGTSQLHFLAVPMNLIKYNGSVLPIVLTIWFASYIERFVDRFTPAALKIIVVPAITILIATPLSLIAIGPVAQFLGNNIAGFISILFDKGGIFAGLIYGALYSVLVVTGMQHGMVPVLIDGISRVGYNFISPVSGSANMAQAGAAFGVWLKSKDKNTKTVAASATISAISGVTEPAIYGVNLRLKKPFLAALIGGSVGGAFAAFFGAKSYAMGGPSFLTLPMFIGEPGNVWLVAVAFLIAFVVAAVTTFIVGFEENPVPDHQ